MEKINQTINKLCSSPAKKEFNFDEQDRFILFLFLFQQLALYLLSRPWRLPFLVEVNLQRDYVDIRKLPRKTHFLNEQVRVLIRNLPAASKISKKGYV